MKGGFKLGGSRERVTTRSLLNVANPAGGLFESVLLELKVEQRLLKILLGSEHERSVPEHLLIKRLTCDEHEPCRFGSRFTGLLRMSEPDSVLLLAAIHVWHLLCAGDDRLVAEHKCVVRSVDDAVRSRVARLANEDITSGQDIAESVPPRWKRLEELATRLESNVKVPALALLGRSDG